MRGSLVAVAVLGAIGCGNDQPEVVTWYQRVAPLLAKHCVACHAPGGVAPFSLTDYASAKANAVRMVDAIETGAMPPFGARAEPDCAPRYGWIDDPRPSRYERWMLEEWIASGYPVGDPTAIPEPPRDTLPYVTTTLAATAGYTVSGTEDQLVCYLLDPGNTEDGWITGLQVRPGAPDFVHHVVVAEIAAGPEQDQLVAAAGVGRPFDCNLGATIPNLGVYIWTPGTQPLRTREGVAVPMVAGAKLTLQIHYHPHGSTGTDVTSVDLAWSRNRPQKAYGVALLGNAISAPNLLPDPDDRDPAAPEFRIPSNVANHTEHMQFTNTSTIPMMIIGPHMHMLGTKLEARRLSSAGDECLFTGPWNFDWQSYYTYDAPLDQLPTLVPGDVVDMRCTYDNTRWNPFMSRWLNDANVPEPQDIYFGQRSIDEMCQLLIGAVSDVPPERDAAGALRDLLAITKFSARTPRGW